MRLKARPSRECRVRLAAEGADLVWCMNGTQTEARTMMTQYSLPISVLKRCIYSLFAIGCFFSSTNQAQSQQIPYGEYECRSTLSTMPVGISFELHPDYTYEYYDKGGHWREQN